MGRKRKTVSKKTKPTPIKQIKVENSSDSSSDVPLSVIKQSLCIKPKHEPNAEAQSSVSADPDKKPWAEKCRQWVDEQHQVTELPPLEPDEDDEPPTDDQSDMPIVSDIPLRKMLKSYSEKEILYSVMYECEWLKCGFETTEDLKYMTHVETHMYQYLSEKSENEELICFWDLCNFRTSSRSELESHVVFHVYHNRVKTRGASLSSIIRIPKCNGDSRRRNCIENFKTQFRCEWGDCDEAFNKIHLFFMHVNCHVQDQFPLDRKSTKQPVQCQWDGCKQQYIRSSLAYEHMRSHSTERTIGCYTCGAIFVSRLKYINHCRRQVDYHQRMYPCSHCDKLFASQQLMIDHRNTHLKKFACTLCPLKFSARKSLAVHIRYRHVSVKPFKCHMCSHRTVTQQDLELHIDRHSKDNDVICTMPGCSVTVRSVRFLKKHYKSVHNPKSAPIYSCHWCDKYYVDAAKLSYHLEQMHACRKQPGHTRFYFRADPIDGRYRLDAFLDDDFAGVPGVKQNKSTKPRKETINDVSPWVSYDIADCRATKGQIVIDIAVTKADMDEHFLSHDDRRMFRCEEFGCNATYKCQRSLKKHVDSVHYGAEPGIYGCHLCDQQYKAGASLSKHLIRAHHFERPPGHCRFNYRANEHGILQLYSNSYEELSLHESLLPDKRNKKAEIKIKAEKIDNDAYEPAKVANISINKLESLSKNTFSIELKLDEAKETPMTTNRPLLPKIIGTESLAPMTSINTEAFNTSTLNMKIEVEEPSTSSLASKSIDDFTVMKRYIKTEKPIVISYEEMDSSGSVIRSETVQTTELNREKLLRGDL